MLLCHGVQERSILAGSEPSQFAKFVAICNLLLLLVYFKAQAFQEGAFDPKYVSCTCLSY